MSDRQPGENWSSKVVQPPWPWGTKPVRPADVSDGLGSIMLARENILEDANYRKIVPNRYIVEVSEDNYQRNFQTIRRQIIQQWVEKLLVRLTTANSRLGRKEYFFGGRVKIDLRPVTDLKPNQVRILYRVQAGDSDEPAVPPEVGPCLEMRRGHRQWRLRSGVMTIGRDARCNIHLDLREVHEKRLVSGQHAYLQSEGDHYRLFDGSPAGKPSVNGTYVNYRRVPPGGQILQNGDLIILAALDPAHPNPSAEGSVALYFHQDCPE